MATVVKDAPLRAANVLGQKPRTETEERAAWVRRARRWKRKATAVLGAEAANEILRTVAALSAADVAGDK
jgi:hypothetical protein